MMSVEKRGGNVELKRGRGKIRGGRRGIERGVWRGGGRGGASAAATGLSSGHERMTQDMDLGQPWQLAPPPTQPRCRSVPRCHSTKEGRQGEHLGHSTLQRGEDTHLGRGVKPHSHGGEMGTPASHTLHTTLGPGLTLCQDSGPVVAPRGHSGATCPSHDSPVHTCRLT